MTVYTEPRKVSDVVRWEVENRFCRKVVTLLKDTDAPDLDVGQVLEASSTKYVICTTGSSANAILLERVLAADLNAADVTAVALVNGPAIVAEAGLTIDSAQLAAAKTALAALLIKAQAYPTNTQLMTDAGPSPATL
jgi:hypothetical protein